MDSRRRVPSAVFDEATAVLDEPDWRYVAQPELSPILRGALDAFYEKGFRGTTVRDISQRAGVTMPTLYYYHGNKEGIFTALLECATKDFLARAYAARDEGGDKPEVRLAYVVESILLRTLISPRMVALEPDIRFLSAPNRDRFERVRTGVERLLLGIVREGRRRGLFTVSDPVLTTRALLDMCDAVPGWYVECPPKYQSVAQKYGAIALNAVGYRADG
ncbi:MULTISPECIES: TetR/AcrR family transcriptional regulator [unclassified Rhodococcus (in: high G+C Gram-positive bacteria)]|uniref:TetR/AcrR family transcriptional regulator n=1 Tax=unclassified Rhodococcus (in: high G+C Gram-positive bacteria) TaxID=192944 RepID=UPI0006840791|nr:TetR/AcrR family transcriptional regulator [Rhodococcus sp. DK17]